MKKNLLYISLCFCFVTSYAASIAKIPQTGPGDGAGVAWPSPRFEPDATGNCMIDNLTGLVWPKNAGLFGKLTWDDHVNPDPNSAQVAIKAMNQKPGSIGYHLCGYNDWRLPNIKELISLCNYSSLDPAEWLTNQGFINISSKNFYSSNQVQSATDKVLAMSYYITCTATAYSTAVNSILGNRNPQYVWPVRGGK